MTVIAKEQSLFTVYKIAFVTAHAVATISNP